MIFWFYGRGSEERLQDFLDSLNTNAYDSKLTDSWSTEVVYFLNVDIYKIEKLLGHTDIF